MEKVILAFESEKTTCRVRDIIEGAGLAECVVCRTAAEVKRLVNRQRLSIVVCGYKLPDETAQDLWSDLPDACSVLVLAGQGMLDMIDDDDIFKLPAPVSRNDLVSTVKMLIQMTRKMERFVRPQRSDQEQTVIQRAKALLMDRNGMTEEQAHRFLQKKSMDSGCKLVQTAQMILDGTWND